MELADQIAALRKRSGLSQEELGEKMNVSRQAVSKWESGKAVPELENLKELSRIFGVSLSELLQLEESGQEKSPENFSAEEKEPEFSQLSAQSNRRGHAVFLFVTVGCILVLAAAVVYMQAQIQGLSRQISLIRNDLSDARSEWGRAVGSLRADIEESLEKQASAISEYHYDVLGLQPFNKEIQVKYSVIPKLCTENTQMILTFSGSDFEPIVLENVEKEGSVFTGTASLPVSHEIRVSVSFLENGESISEALDTIYGLDEHLLTVTSTFQGEISRYAMIDQSAGTLAINGSLVIEAMMHDTAYPALANYPDSGTVRLYKDRKVFREYEVNFYENLSKPDCEQGNAAIEAYSSIAAAIPMEESFPSGEWQQVAIEITVVDRFGIQYKQTAYAFGAEEGHEDDPDYIKETEILYPTK